MKNKRNLMYLVLGDWSDDGHGKTEKVLLESNLSVDEVKTAYKDACRLTGVQWNDNTNYTGIKNPPEICTDYEDPYVPSEAIKKLKKFGLNDELVQSWNEDDEMTELNCEENEPFALYGDTFVNMWIWFVKLARPDLELKKAKNKDAIPCINGYWDDDLNVQFGYGMYT